jgi:hypothetical protein
MGSPGWQVFRGMATCAATAGAGRFVDHGPQPPRGRVSSPLPVAATY